MSIDLVTRYLPLVDEKFSTESKTSAVTNADFTFDGANSVAIRKVSTVPLADYGRSGPASGNWSRYGEVGTLDSVSETFTLSQDKSFTFVIDRLDEDEAAESLAPAKALERQLREVVIPHIDGYVIGKIVTGAGNVGYGQLNAANIYAKIIAATEALDIAEAPEDGRVLLVTPAVYSMMKTAEGIKIEGIGADIVRSGQIGTLDGMSIIKVPASRMPEGVGFIVCHPVATTGVQKLAAYKLHTDPPGISGTLVEGRIVFDAFVRDHKAKAIYVHMNEEEPEPEPEYVLTTDTTVQEGKTYYEKDGDEYDEVTPVGTENPSQEGWYELVEPDDE